MVVGGPNARDDYHIEVGEVRTQSVDDQSKIRD